MRLLEVICAKILPYLQKFNKHFSISYLPYFFNGSLFQLMFYSWSWLLHGVLSGSRPPVFNGEEINLFTLILHWKTPPLRPQRATKEQTDAEVWYMKINAEKHLQYRRVTACLDRIQGILYDSVYRIGWRKTFSKNKRCPIPLFLHVFKEHLNNPLGTLYVSHISHVAECL